MPPFLRLITCNYMWSVHLILIVACLLQNGVIQVVYSDLPVGYTIEIGNLTSNAVLTKLSNGLNQQAWWRLADAQWHDSAISRFFEAGPLLAADMDQLAKQNGKSDSWKASGIGGVNITDDIKLALQTVSTATYQMNKSIKGTGKIQASMWTPLFLCMDTASCNEGYFVPMVTIPNSNDKAQQATDAESSEYSFATLWLSVGTNLLVNAIPSYIGKLSRVDVDATNLLDGVADEPELSKVINVYNDVPQCAPDRPIPFGIRSLLDASYGLIPGVVCIQFSTNDGLPPLKLLLFFGLYSVNVTGEPQILRSLETYLSDFLQVNMTNQWEQLPFEECSGAMFMRKLLDEPDNANRLCDQNSSICIANDASGSGGEATTCTGVERLRFLQSAVNLSSSCTYINESSGTVSPLVADLVQMPPTNVSCPMSTEHCTGILNFFNFSQSYILMFSPDSNWTGTEGKKTSEFSEAPHMTNFDASHACVGNISFLRLTNTSKAALLQAIQIRAIAYLNSFIAEHNLAFTTNQGPATDLANFVALIVSTAISVILGISGPFTSILLRIICRWRPLHLDSQRARVRKVVKVLFQMLCAVLLSFCSFLPVLYLALSERNREEPFYTWDLGSADQAIFSPALQDFNLRVVYLLSATSIYSSHFIYLSVGVVCFTCCLVGVSSAVRCKEVLDRNRLLQKHDSIQAGNDPVVRTDITEDRETLYLRALKAIYMTEVEYQKIKAEVRRHVERTAQELAYAPHHRRGHQAGAQESAQYTGAHTFIGTENGHPRDQSTEAGLLPVGYIPSTLINW